MLGTFSYLFWLFIFCVPPIVYVWARKHVWLRKNIKVIGIVVGASVAGWPVADLFGTSWHAWSYSDSRVIGIWIFGAPIEDGLYAAVVAFVVASAVLSFIDSKRRGKHRWLLGN